MPDVDSLAFDIRFALAHKAIGARPQVRPVAVRRSEADLDWLCREIADHLRRCRWRQLPPEPLATGDQGPMVAGGLMSYSANVRDAFRQTGIYVGRILKGTKPVDLPVLQPNKVEFVINLTWGI